MGKASSRRPFSQFVLFNEKLFNYLDCVLYTRNMWHNKLILCCNNNVYKEIMVNIQYFNNKKIFYKFLLREITRIKMINDVFIIDTIFYFSVILQHDDLSSIQFLSYHRSGYSRCARDPSRSLHLHPSRFNYIRTPDNMYKFVYLYG